MPRGAAALRYLDIYVGKPSIEENYIVEDITPQQCRLRDMTYAAPISVDVEYTRGKEIVVRKGKNGQGALVIGRLPIMLRSDRCVLKVELPAPRPPCSTAGAPTDPAAWPGKAATWGGAQPAARGDFGADDALGENGESELTRGGWWAGQVGA